MPSPKSLSLSSWVLNSLRDCFPIPSAYVKSELQAPFPNSLPLRVFDLSRGWTTTVLLLFYLTGHQHPSRESQASLLWWSFFLMPLVKVDSHPEEYSVPSTLFMSLQCLLPALWHYLCVCLSWLSGSSLVMAVTGNVGKCLIDECWVLVLILLGGLAVGFVVDLMW